MEVQRNLPFNLVIIHGRHVEEITSQMVMMRMAIGQTMIMMEHILMRMESVFIPNLARIHIVSQVTNYAQRMLACAVCAR